MRVRETKTWVGNDGFSHAEFTVDTPNGPMPLRLTFDDRKTLDVAVLRMTQLAIDAKAAEAPTDTQ